MSNPTHVRLPNGAIVALDEHGYVAVKVQIELADLMGDGLEAALDAISDAATGTDALSDISYTVVGHAGGNALDILARGSIELIEHEVLSYDELPLVEFEAQVTRVSYGSRTVRLSAKTLDDARGIADDDAGNHAYDEHHAHYEVDVTQVGGMQPEPARRPTDATLAPGAGPQVDTEVTVQLACGWTLRSGVFDLKDPNALVSGEYVRLCRPDGTESLFWAAEEWRDEPALVMGAIMNTAAAVAANVAKPSNADGEQCYRQAVADQGWNTDSQISLLESLIKAKGLWPEVAELARGQANEENSLAAGR